MLTTAPRGGAAAARARLPPRRRPLPQRAAAAARSAAHAKAPDAVAGELELEGLLEHAAAHLSDAGKEAGGEETPCKCGGRCGAHAAGGAAALSSVEEAIAAVAAGSFAVVADDEGRENEGDLIGAAERMTPEAMAFMVRYTSGVICVGLPGERCDALELPLMVPPDANSDAMATAFTVTCDLAEGTTTGISASDRAATLRALADPEASPAAFNRPGHIFPLRARAEGVLARRGHTEAAVDLARLAGCAPAGVLCELVNDDGSMQRMPQLRAFAAQHGLPIITVEQLVAHRENCECCGKRNKHAGAELKTAEAVAA